MESLGKKTCQQNPCNGQSAFDINLNDVDNLKVNLFGKTNKNDT